MLPKYKGQVFIDELKKKYRKKIDVDCIVRCTYYNPKNGCYQTGWELTLEDECGSLFEHNGELEYCSHDDGKLKKFFEKKGNIKINVPWTI